MSEKKSGRFTWGKTKEVSFTERDIDILTDVAVMLNDIATHEGVDVEVKMGQATEALKELDEFFRFHGFDI